MYPTLIQMRNKTAKEHCCNICWLIIFTAMISTGQSPFADASQNIARLPKPACYIEYEGIVDRCSYSEENFSNGYILQNFNGSEGVWNNGLSYVNISITYPEGFSGILQVYVFEQFRFGRVLLQIDTRTSIYRNNHHPYKLIVSYLPFNLSELTVRQLGPRRDSYLTDDPCLHPVSINECTILINKSNLVLKSYGRSIELKLNRSFYHPLKVELYGRHCPSSCDDMSSQCSTNLTSLQWLNPLKEFTVHDLQPAHYCARVVYNTHGMDCCIIFTETAYVHHVQWITHSAHNFHQSTFFHVMLMVLILTAVMAAFIHFLYCKGIIRNLYERVHEHNFKEDTQLVSIQKEDPQEYEILLLYPKKEELFMNSMTAFRKLLKVYTKRVWDPLEDEQIEHAVQNPARWMQQVLMIENLKIVLVETEEAVTWLAEMVKTLDVSEEDLYFYAISIILNHPQLMFNYQRLLVVRFDNLKPLTTLTLNLVPQKRYHMPHQLGLLLMDIINCHEYSIDDEQSPDGTANQFCRLTEEYQRSFRTQSKNIQCS